MPLKMTFCCLFLLWALMAHPSDSESSEDGFVHMAPAPLSPRGQQELENTYALVCAHIALGGAPLDCQPEPIQQAVQYYIVYGALPPNILPSDMPAYILDVLNIEEDPLDQDGDSAAAFAAMEQDFHERAAAEMATFQAAALDTISPTVTSVLQGWMQDVGLPLSPATEGPYIEAIKNKGQLWLVSQFDLENAYMAQLRALFQDVEAPAPYDTAACATAEVAQWSDDDQNPQQGAPQCIADAMGACIPPGDFSHTFLKTVNKALESIVARLVSIESANQAMLHYQADVPQRAILAN